MGVTGPLLTAANASVPGSIYFPAGSYLKSNSRITLGTGAMTFEAWFKLTLNPATNRIVLVGSSGGDNFRGFSLYNGSYGTPSATVLQVDWEMAGNQPFDVPTMVADTWYHVAVSRNSSNQMSLWLNGVRSTTGKVLQAYDFQANYYYPGTWPGRFTSTDPFYMSNMRFTTTNIYNPDSASITVPDTELTAVTGTQFLLNTRFDAASYKTEAISGVSLTATGSPSSSNLSPALKTLPTVSGLSVTTGLGIGGTTTTISGANLETATSVTVGGSAAAIVTNTATAITITTPAGSDGAKNVVVTTAAGSATSVGAFTYFSKLAITYSGGVGSSGTAPEQASLAPSETFTVSSGSTLSKTGYTFSKWKNVANVEYLPGATFTVGYTADTLTAQWTLNSYSVSYIAGTNGSISGTNPQTVSYGANASTVTAVPDSHYHFNAWDDGVLTGARTDLNITGAITKTASFAIDTLTATYTAGANGSISGVGVQTINYGDSATSVTAVAASHYHFDSWSDGLKTAARRDLNLNTSIARSASFAIDTFTVTFNANGGSNGSVAAINYNANALSSAPSATRSSYSLLGWSETTTGTILTSWTVVADKTLYAIWNPNIYTITYSPESGTVTTSSETFTVLSKPASWQIPTRSSYVFDGWYTSTSYTTLRGLGGAAFTSNDTETVYAKWTQESISGIPVADRTFVDSLKSTDGSTKTLTIESGSTGASIRVPSGALPNETIVSVYSLGNSDYAKSKIDATKEYVVNLIVAWVASDGTVPVASPALTMTITNPAIKSGAIVYGLLGNTYTQLGTATADGSVAFSITTDPVITIANPVATPPAPGGGGGGGSVSVTTTVIDDSAAIKAAKEKTEAEAKAKAELDLKAAQEKAAAELQAARDKAEAEIKAAQLASDAAALLKAEEEAKLAAERKASEDATLAASIALTNIVPDVSLFSVSASLKLSTYDTAYLKKYVKSLKPKATVTCIGYIYTAKTKVSVATTRAKKQATAVCSIIKRMKPTLITKVILVSSKKAPKAAVGAKWVAVSYRVDGYKS
jgi:hypothetical protein